MLILLDSNVYVSAALTPRGPGDRIVAAAEAGVVDLVASPRLLRELAAVLSRPRFRAHLSLSEVGLFVDRMEALAVVVPDPAPAGRWVRDPTDDYLVELARAAGADLLVSGDKDLLAVDPEVVKVVTPREAADGMSG